MENNNLKRIIDNIKYPVEYIKWDIFDSDNKHILRIRWRWWMQYKENWEDLQDSIWMFVAEAINEKLVKSE